ncbi:MAG: hypothetical protein V3V08_25775 [Nannocystaceae bacterium]
MSLLLACCACAQITTTSTVKLVRGPGPPLQLEPDGVVVRSTSYRAQWKQVGHELAVDLSERRSCRALLHVPVVRIEHVAKRPDATLIWEYALGAGLGAFAGFALVRPDLFGTKLISTTGEIVYDPSSARRISTTFGSISGMLLASAIYDTARAVDSTVYADAYRVELGGPRRCRHPNPPLQHHRVELVVGKYRDEGTTNERGHVEFQLPPEPALHLPQQPPTTTEKRVHHGAILVDRDHAVAVDYQTPYNASIIPHFGPRPQQVYPLELAPNRMRMRVTPRPPHQTEAEKRAKPVNARPPPTDSPDRDATNLRY